MEHDRLIQHVRKTLVHTLSKHQYGIVDNEKNTSIVNTMVEYLQGLHDAHYIYDFVLSVINVSDDCISSSVALKRLKGGEFILIQADLHTRFDASSHDGDFDRAMDGV